MSKADMLGKMYCLTTCSNNVKDCMVAKEMGRDFCPKCGTVITHRDEEGYPTKWHGGDGLIPVAREDRHYVKNYACNCEVGKLRIDQKIRPYIFHGDEVCMLERTFQHLEMKWRRNKLNERPKYSNVQEKMLSILENIKKQEQGDGDTPFD